MLADADIVPYTYSAAVTALAVAATATDVFTITGSATKIIYVWRITISGSQTSESTENVLVIKRSTADTGGTSSSVTAVPRDSKNPAATATVLSYTANPTLGTTVGTVHSVKLILPAVAPGQPANIIEHIPFGDDIQPIILRGTSEVLAVNLNSTTIVGSSFNITVEWTEA